MLAVARLIAGLASAGLLLIGSMASAANYRVDFSGTIVHGSDSGLFGPAGALDGDAFVATYTYDLASGGRYLIPGVLDSIEPITASLKINGVTYHFQTYGPITELGRATPQNLSFDYLAAIDADPVDIEHMAISATSPLFGPSLAFDAEAVIPVHAGGGFSVSICCCPDCQSDFVDVYSSGTFDTTSVHLFVPEPTTWALMILGFGLTGSVLRRDRTGARREQAASGGAWAGPPPA